MGYPLEISAGSQLLDLFLISIKSIIRQQQNKTKIISMVLFYSYIHFENQDFFLHGNFVKIQTDI